MPTVSASVSSGRASRYVVEHVDYLIAYAWHPASNDRELAEYAQQREKQGKIKSTVLPRK